MIIYGHFQQAIDYLSRMHMCDNYGELCDPIEIDIIDFMNKIDKSFNEFMPLETPVKIHRSYRSINIVFESKPEIQFYCSRDLDGKLNHCLRVIPNITLKNKKIDIEVQEDIYQFLLNCKKLGKICLDYEKEPNHA